MPKFRGTFLVFATLGIMSGASGCAKILGLPDVTILQTQYPVVHFVRLPTPVVSPVLSGSLSSKKPPRAIPSPTPLGAQIVTWEKQRPASWIGVGEVSKVAVGAIVVSEDWAFYQHKGYDPNQIKEAVNHDLAKGKFARGASTITQQVAKNVFLDSEKSMLRKAKELMLAVKLEEKFKKPKILEVYLNIAEFGEDLYGIGPASRFYFNKSPSELTAKEGAFLAMLLPSPKRYSQSFRAKHLTDYASKTISDILGKMVQAQYLTDEQQSSEIARPLSFEIAAVNADNVLKGSAAQGGQAQPPEPPENSGLEETGNDRSE